MADLKIHSESIQEKAAEMLHDYFIPFIISGFIFFFLLGLVVNLLVKFLLTK